MNTAPELLTLCILDERAAAPAFRPRNGDDVSVPNSRLSARGGAEKGRAAPAFRPRNGDDVSVPNSRLSARGAAEKGRAAPAFRAEGVNGARAEHGAAPSRQVSSGDRGVGQLVLMPLLVLRLVESVLVVGPSTRVHPSS